jgi:hypothetical protein
MQQPSTTKYAANSFQVILNRFKLYLDIVYPRHSTNKVSFLSDVLIG